MLTTPQEPDFHPKASRRAQILRLGLLVLLGVELATAAFFCSMSIKIGLETFPHGVEPTGLLAVLDDKVWAIAVGLGALYLAREFYRLARSSRRGMPSVVPPLILHILIISACSFAAALAAKPIVQGIADLG